MTILQRAAILDSEKENRVPRAMAAPGSNGKKKLTPGRAQRQDQYFEIGKVGRKTGITLKDTGIRDEYGMEPMSGIFSSPVSPRRYGDRTLTDSDDMSVQDSSAPDVNETLRLRNTPKLPPPRAGTPKHTYIGSPKRMSAARPVFTRPARIQDDERPDSRHSSGSEQRPNRVLQFGGDSVHNTIEVRSPFKPTKNLRRSTGVARQDLFESSRKSRSGDVTQASQELDRTLHEQELEDYDETEAQLPVEDDPPLLDNDDYGDEQDGYQPLHDNDDIIEIEDETGEDVLHEETPLGHKQRTSRISDIGSVTQISRTPESTRRSSGKRDRTTMETSQLDEDASESQVQVEYGTPAQSQKRSRQSNSRTLLVHQDDTVRTIDPSLLAHGDEYSIVEPEEEAVQPEPKVKAKSKQKSAPKERDPNRPVGSKSKAKSVEPNDRVGSLSPSKRATSRGASVGPISNVHLRATTPLEDSNGRTSRYGRSVIQPLKYWENESRVWKHGEIEGIIRADHVVQPKRASGKKKFKAKKRKAPTSGLEDIAEESEVESVAADEWEDELGVIAGEVAQWDSETQEGDPNEPIREDLAFASSAIQFRDVAGSEFKYAKIISLPFFGSGVVEIPPNGYKKAKSSRDKQMAFFVHEGKVLVEIGAPGMEITQFAITKGGLWVVPRGNTYAIANESTTKTARVFFAQGAEVVAGSTDESQ
ncbi:Hypothetical protein R9X50_00712500 [Acrodontium crateriforme]|uniref:Centromere protein 3 n=1 Tax=Acrodontium crateriforme TaxID=150365 RepID=A0AAQ3R7C2_9PEZI|nr:Hypothetical protein R9X50_00712500 [Acrodontium crateriforme]